MIALPEGNMKRILCMILVAAAAVLMLTACGSTQKLDRIDTGSVKHITVATEANAEPKFDIIKRKGVVVLVDLYDSAEFTETDEVKAEELLAETLYHFKFYDYQEKLIAEYSLSPQGYLFKGDDLTKPYKLTKDFDEESITQTAELYDKNALPQ